MSAIRRPLAGMGTLSLLLALLPLFVHAAPPARAEPYDALRQDIEARIADGRLTGVAVALVHDGRIVWEDGFGWADRETGRRAGSRVAFSVASTTKPFTTTAMMTLVRSGALSLDAPVNTYLGPHEIVDEAGPAAGVTLRRLATHSAGMPTFFAMYPEGGGARRPSVDALLRDYGHVVAPPGERYEYSNLGMAVIAEVVARRSGQAFGTYLRQHVLEPLGMRDSFFARDIERLPEMATRYADDGTRLPFYLTATPGSGELYASAHDLARFAMFHLGERVPGAQVLDADALRLLHAPATPIAGPLHYAMGWQVWRSEAFGEVLYHGGGQSGVAAEFVLVPEAGAAAVVVSNRRGDRAFFESLRDRMLRSVVPGWRGIPAAPQPGVVPLAPLRDYLGQWRGTLLAQGRQVPIRLSIAGAGDARLSLDGGPDAPVEDIGLVDGRLSGDVHAAIDAPDARRERLERLSLDLTLRGDRIDGEIVAWRKTSTNMTILPFWTRLRRAEARAPAADGGRAPPATR